MDESQADRQTRAATNHYLFITPEGHTYQPHSEAVEPDIDNCQLLGWASGDSAEAAFARLVDENPWLLETTFEVVMVLKLL